MANTTERLLGRLATGTPQLGPVSPASPPTPLLVPPADAELFAGLYPVTYIGEFEKPNEWTFPLEHSRITLGGSRILTSSPGSAISIPGRGLSGIHCLLERRATSIRVHDKGSTNGTYVGNTRIAPSWDIRIGDKFSPLPLTLFLMDDVMHAHRGMLAEILGRGFQPSPDVILTEVVRQACHLIIMGEEGCGQDRLARAIHDMSQRRAHAPIPLDDIPTDRAAQSAIIRAASQPKTTVVLKAGSAPLDPTFLSSLYSASYGVRVIVLAADLQEAETALSKPQLLQSYHINLRPLAYRSEEICQILDRMFAARDAPHLKTADMFGENQEALRSHNWPKNLAQLHCVADAIVAHEEHGGVRAAGRVLGMSPTTLHGHLTRVGLTMRKGVSLFKR